MNAGVTTARLGVVLFLTVLASLQTAAQTLEVFEFMTAAQLSKERGGAAVPLAELRK